jgi:hypothetical protein
VVDQDVGEIQSCHQDTTSKRSTCQAVFACRETEFWKGEQRNSRRR